MNNYILLLLLFLSACKSGNQNTDVNKDTPNNELQQNTPALKPIHSGDWTYEEKRNGKVVTTFRLHLVVNGNAIAGNYCSVTQSGNRIDCADDGINNISGIIEKNIALINLKGNYDSKATGEAKIFLSAEGLQWELTGFKGNVYLLKKAILTPESQPVNNITNKNAMPVSGSDIDKLPFKEVKEQILGLDDFYCGMYPKAYDCPMVGKFQVRIMSNDCGDFPFYSLVTTFRGRFVDKKMIYMHEGEGQDGRIISTSFSIDSNYKIIIYEEDTVNGNTSKNAEIYRIDERTGIISKAH